MPQTDILNPTPTHPLNPDYSYQRKRPLTHLNAKANQGPPYFREITDSGHSFIFNWVDKLESHARSLKRYYEQYRNGFFTYVDHEGGGRQYVGRLVTPVEPSPTSHNHWAIQGVQFDEVPLSPMLVYPGDWVNDAVWAKLLDDWGNRMVAAVSGTWTLTADANAISGYHFSDAGTVTTDQATYVYAGYGFQFWAPTGPAMGKASVVLDGTIVGTVDFYTAAAQKSSMLLQVQNVMLGIHAVSLVPLNAKDGGSSGYTVMWDALKVMR